jgi:dsDNA-specific endonuclease/ATPase MutS2
MIYHSVVEELLHEIRSHIAAIYSVNDCIALLDMLVSFATFASTCEESVRPEITEDGPIAINAGRHPISMADVNLHPVSYYTFIHFPHVIERVITIYIRHIRMVRPIRLATDTWY